MKDFTNSRAYYVILILFIFIAFAVGGYRTITTNPEVITLGDFGTEEEASEALESSEAMVRQSVSKVNLLSNPSFETDPGSYVFKVGSDNNKWNNEFARTGEYSYYLGPLQEGSTSPFSAVFVEVPAGSLKNRVEYEVSAWYKTAEVASDAELSLEIGLYTADGEYIATYTEDMYAAEEWTNVSERVLTRDFPTAFRVEFILSGGTADVWIDDISLVEM